MEEIKFSSEQSGIPIVKESPSIDSGIPFHQHTGTDGSPKIMLNNMTNREDLEGGKFIDSNTATSVSIAGAWATLTDFNASKKVVSEKRFLLMLSGGFAYSGIGGSDVELRFDIDGTNTITLVRFYDADGGLNGDQVGFSVHFITSLLSAATHTFQVEARATTGSGELVNAIFSILELTG